MAIAITIKGQKAKNGERMKGSGWHLATTKGRKRIFKAKLLSVHNLGSQRIAVFSVPKR
jgi:hypothetical protein